MIILKFIIFIMIMVSNVDDHIDDNGVDDDGII